LIGRAPGADVVLDDHAVNARHVYLHLDRRGIFAVDLATRTGSRIGSLEQSAAWLRPGETIEVAGYHIELAALHVDDADLAGDSGVDPLDDVSEGPDVSLCSNDGTLPLVLRSQLVFAGRAEECGLCIDDSRLAPVQCVFVRASHAVFVVDLMGQAVRLNGYPVRRATLLNDGDLLTICDSPFECRVKGDLLIGMDRAQQLPLPIRNRALRKHHTSTETEPSELQAPGPLPRLARLAIDRLANEDQETVLAWMLGALQATHEELLRRQDVFQVDIMRALRGLQKQQTTVHGMQLERLDHLNYEVAQLRDEVRRCYGESAPAHRTESPRALPSVPTVPTKGSLIDETNAWLARRIGQIQQENQIGRRAATKKS
jgi:pSer/pThr/pTyr-binding forkhead associated (FHA) protein